MQIKDKQNSSFLAPIKALFVRKFTVFLGLLATFILTSNNAVAESFPYLSPLNEQKEYIANGIIHQWNIFKMISDGNQALFYLALTGALVGFFLILTKKSNQTLPVMGGWLVLVLALIITPVGSKLLFYDVPEAGDKVKGFTPQLLVIHVASTIHESLLYYFESKSFSDIVQKALDAQAFRNAKFARVSSGQFEDMAKFKKECQNTPILPAELQSTSASSVAIHSTYGKVMSEIKDYYTRVGNTFAIPPPAIVLPASESQMAGWGVDMKADYRLGLEKLYKNLEPNSFVPAGSGGQVEAYIDAIFKSGLLSANSCSGSGCGPSKLGFFIASGSSGLSLPTNSVVVAGRSSSSGPNPSYPYKNYSASYNAKSPDIGKYINPKMIPSEIYEMPVLVGNYNPSTNTVVAASSCDSSANELAASTLKDTLSEGWWFTDMNDRLGETFKDSFVQSLQTGDGFDAEKMEYADAGKTPYCTTNFVNGKLAERCKWSSGVKEFVNFYNSSIYDSNLTADELRSNLITAIVETAYINTDAELENKARNAAAEKGMETTTASDFANSEIGAGLVGVGGFLADAATRVLAKVVGVLAKIFIRFLISFVDITLLVILIVTPLAMIAGLIIPSYSLGVIILVTVSVLVLKVVPITFMFINMITGLVYQVLGNVGDQGVMDALMGTFAQNILVIAAAFMYMSVVGITLFIMFKIGDPSSVSKLAMLDSAAQTFAKAGLALAGAAGVGVVAAGLGASASRKARSEAKANEAIGDDHKYQQDALKAEGEGKNWDEDTIAEKQSALDKQQAMERKEEGKLTWGEALAGGKDGIQAGALETGEMALGVAGSFLPGGPASLAQGMNALTQGRARGVAIGKAGGGFKYWQQKDAAAVAGYSKQESSAAGAAEWLDKADQYAETDNAQHHGSSEAARGIGESLGTHKATFGDEIAVAKEKSIQQDRAIHEAAITASQRTEEDYRKEAIGNEIKNREAFATSVKSFDTGAGTALASALGENEDIVKEIEKSKDYKRHVREGLKSDNTQGEIAGLVAEKTIEEQGKIAKRVERGMNSTSGKEEVTAKVADLQSDLTNNKLELSAKLDDLNKLEGPELKAKLEDISQIEGDIKGIDALLNNPGELRAIARAQVKDSKIQQILEEPTGKSQKSKLERIESSAKAAIKRQVQEGVLINTLEDEAARIYAGEKSVFSSANKFIGSENQRSRVIEAAEAKFVSRASRGKSVAYGIKEGLERYHSADISDTFISERRHAGSVMVNKEFEETQGGKKVNKKLTRGMMKVDNLWNYSSSEASGWRASAGIGYFAGNTDWGNKIKMEVRESRDGFARMDMAAKLNSTSDSRIDVIYNQVNASYDQKLSSNDSRTKIQNIGQVKAMAATRAKLRAESETSLIVKSSQGGKANRPLYVDVGFGREQFDGPRDEIAGILKGSYEKIVRKEIEELRSTGGSKKKVKLGRGVDMDITPNMDFADVAQQVGVLAEKAIGKSTLKYKELTGKRFLNTKHNVNLDRKFSVKNSKGSKNIELGAHGAWSLNAGKKDLIDTLGWDARVVDTMIDNGDIYVKNDGKIAFVSGIGSKLDDRSIKSLSRNNKKARKEPREGDA